MEKSIMGYLSGTSKLSGVLSGTGQLEGVLSIPERYGGDPYQGDYEVIPSAGFQLLLTADKTLEDDILVHPIPYSEVSNLSGGYTATIGG